MQVALLRRGTQDLFTSPAFMLHAFTARPEGEGDLAADPPITSGSAPPPHNIDIAKVTATYTALLQVLSHAAATLSHKAGAKVSLLGVCCPALNSCCMMISAVSKLLPLLGL